MRWLLLDEIIEIEAGVRAKTRSKIPDSEYSPEILMIEMIAQTGALLLGAVHDFKKDMVFAKVEKAHFSGPLEKGMPIEIEATCDAFHDDGAWIEGVVLKASEPIAHAKCLLMNISGLVEGQSKPITFHENFMQHFGVLTKVK